MIYKDVKVVVIMNFRINNIDSNRNNQYQTTFFVYKKGNCYKKSIMGKNLNIKNIY